MPPTVPDSLRALLDARTAADAEHAWTAFLESHSELLLRVARSFGGDQDGCMDRYTFVLERLRRDDFQRLRSFDSVVRADFAVWLVVVARRLCLDLHRQRYGRPQSDTTDARERHLERRNLTDLMSNELDLEALASPAEQVPDTLLQRADLHAALEAALARLDPGDRLLLRLRFEDDLSVPEIARLQRARSPFAVYRRIERLLATLRRALQESGIRESAP